MAVNSIFKSVLLIDDNKIDSILGKKTLEKDGFAENVITYNNAKEAIAYLKSIENKEFEYIPSLILVDIMMPEMNGLQFLEAFENLPESISSLSKIIFLSGSTPTYDQKVTLSNSSSVLMFVSKPLDKPSLDNIAKAFSNL